MNKNTILFFLFLSTFLFSYVPDTYPMRVSGTYDLSAIGSAQTLQVYVQDTLAKEQSFTQINGDYTITFGGHQDDQVSFRICEHEITSFQFEEFGQVTQDLVASLAANGETCSCDAICSSGHCCSGVCKSSCSGGGSGGGGSGGSTGGGSGGGGGGGGSAGTIFFSQIELLEEDQGVCPISITRTYHYDQTNNWTIIETTVSNNAEVGNDKCEYELFAFIDHIIDTNESLDQIFFHPAPNEKNETTRTVKYIANGFGPQASLEFMYRFHEIINTSRFNFTYEIEKQLKNQTSEQIILKVQTNTSVFVNDRVYIKLLDEQGIAVPNRIITVITPASIPDNITLLTNSNGEASFIASQPGTYTYKIQEPYVFDKQYTTIVKEKQTEPEPPPTPEKKEIILQVPNNITQGQFITITAKYKSGEPATGISIRIVYPDGSSYDFITDENGQISFLARQAGSYSFFAKGQSIVSTQADITVSEHKAEQKKEQGILETIVELVKKAASLIIPVAILAVVIVIIYLVYRKFKKRRGLGA